MLAIKNISKTFYSRTSEKKVIDRLSCTVKKGQVFGFLGLNGAGKTTVVKMIVGLLGRDQGEITIDGQLANSAQALKKVGFMSEAPNFYRHLSVREVLRFAGELHQLDAATIEARSATLLKKVGLESAADTPTRQLSKGMNQRLGFAVALINDPELLILDEPLDGLDPLGRLDFKKLIREAKRNGTTVFFSSHILSDVEELCDEIAILDRGRLIRQGSPKSLLAKSNQTLEEYFVQTVSGTGEAKK